MRGFVRILWASLLLASTAFADVTGVVTPPGGAGGGGCTLANPTASIGLTAANGIATTCLRSDAAQALDQTIAPTWTGLHTFASTEPRIRFDQTGAGTDLKWWDIDVTSGVACFRTRTDADGAGLNAICFTRGTTTNVSGITFGNATSATTFNFNAGTMTFPGGGTVTGGGSLSSARFFPTGTAAGGSLYLASSPGTLGIGGALVSGGTKFTTSGCSISSTTGGATAGIFTLGANTCTAVITMNGVTVATAPTGWTCQAHDRTAPTVLIGGESSSTTTTASFTIPAGAGATDVISFSCTGY